MLLVGEGEGEGIQKAAGVEEVEYGGESWNSEYWHYEW